MSELELTPGSRPPVTSALYLLITAAVSFVVVGPLIGVVLAMPFMNFPVSELQAKLVHPDAHPEIVLPLKIIQGCTTFFGLIVGPSLYWYSFERKSVLGLFQNNPQPLVIFFLTGLLAIAFVAPDSVIVSWNAGMTLPDFLGAFGKWMRIREDEAKILTDVFTRVDSYYDLPIGFIVIAILPAIGEELVFRGMLQALFHRATNNPHLGIWISAFLFSAIHLQFFGFVPRMLLGALFGYLYLWSGNLLIPIFAHFVNNGLALVAMYLNQIGKIDVDLESTDVMPWSMVITGTILTFGFVFYLKQYFQQKQSSLGHGPE